MFCVELSLALAFTVLLMRQPGWILSWKNKGSIYDSHCRTKTGRDCSRCLQWNKQKPHAANGDEGVIETKVQQERMDGHSVDGMRLKNLLACQCVCVALPPGLQKVQTHILFKKWFTLFFLYVFSIWNSGFWTLTAGAYLHGAFCQLLINSTSTGAMASITFGIL